MTQCTFIMIKPDAVGEGHIGQILSRYESEGLGIVALERRLMDDDCAARHYMDHVGRDYYEELRDFMTSGPVVAAVLCGDDAIARVRTLHGATDPAKAAPGTIRAQYATSTRHNAVHASDSLESAAREIALWFPNL